MTVSATIVTITVVVAAAAALHRLWSTRMGRAHRRMAEAVAADAELQAQADRLLAEARAADEGTPFNPMRDRCRREGRQRPRR